jgi:hypothetical protein
VRTPPQVSRTTSATRSQQRELQSRINCGEFASKHALLAHIATTDLIITRNGRDYLGLRGLDGKRIRIRFCLSEDGRIVGAAAPNAAVVHPTERRAGQALRSICIYALLAFSATSARCACYVGQTVHPRRRMREHVVRSSHGGGSGQLIAWAQCEGAQVLCVELESRLCTSNEAGEMEQLWTVRAMNAGFETPGIDRWGRRALAKRDECSVDGWPGERVRLAARSLAGVVAGKLSLPTLQRVNA